VLVTALGPDFTTRHNPRTTMISPPDLHQRLARTLIAAMKDPGAPGRLISVSTASMGPADAVMGAGPRLLFRFFRTVVTPNLGRVGRDLQAMEDELAATGLDWYAPRPVKLTDGPLTGHVQASARFTMKTISRADVAWYILSLAEDPRPGQLRTPIITTGGGRSSSRPEAEDLAAQRTHQAAPAASPLRAPASPSIAACTSRGPGSMVISTSAAAAACAGVSRQLAPHATAASSASARLSVAVT